MPENDRKNIFIDNETTKKVLMFLDVKALIER